VGCPYALGRKLYLLTYVVSLSGVPRLD
jgi:hypothetical protein